MLSRHYFPHFCPALSIDPSPAWSTLHHHCHAGPKTRTREICLPNGKTGENDDDNDSKYDEELSENK